MHGAKQPQRVNIPWKPTGIAKVHFLQWPSTAHKEFLALLITRLPLREKMTLLMWNGVELGVCQRMPIERNCVSNAPGLRLRRKVSMAIRWRARKMVIVFSFLWRVFALRRASSMSVRVAFIGHRRLMSMTRVSRVMSTLLLTKQISHKLLIFNTILCQIWTFLTIFGSFWSPFLY